MNKFTKILSLLLGINTLVLNSSIRAADNAGNAYNWENLNINKLILEGSYTSGSTGTGNNSGNCKTNTLEEYLSKFLEKNLRKCEVKKYELFTTEDERFIKNEKYIRLVEEGNELFDKINTTLGVFRSSRDTKIFNKAFLFIWIAANFLVVNKENAEISLGFIFNPKTSEGKLLDLKNYVCDLFTLLEDNSSFYFQIKCKYDNSKDIRKYEISIGNYVFNIEASEIDLSSNDSFNCFFEYMSHVYPLYTSTKDKKVNKKASNFLDSYKKNKENCLSSFKSNPSEYVIEQSEFNVEVKEIKTVEDKDKSNDNVILKFYFYF